MRRKNRKKYPAIKTEVETFTAYRVVVKGLGSLAIFAGSAKAAEHVVRKILGGLDLAYDGPLEMYKEEKMDTPR